jgi:acetyltransferase
MINRDNGLELILGMKNDQIFGPVILLGIGGIFVEVFKEVVCRIAPITNQSARYMVRKLKGYQILEGARGKPKLSIAELEQALLDLSRLSLDFGNIISEIDINPLIVLEEGKGVTAADVLIIKKKAN